MSAAQAALEALQAALKAQNPTEIERATAQLTQALDDLALSDGAALKSVQAIVGFLHRHEQQRRRLQLSFAGHSHATDFAHRS